MLESILQQIEKNRNYQITVMFYGNEEYDVRKYGDINFIHIPTNLFDINHIVGHFDTFIFGGGAIIDDDYYTEKNLNFFDLGTLFVELSTRVIKRGKKLICLGLSSNKDLINYTYIEKLKVITKEAKHFSVRDKNSADTMTRSGIERTNFSLINDIALANSDIKFHKKNKTGSYQVGVNLICDDVVSIHFIAIIAGIERGLKNIYEY